MQGGGAEKMSQDLSDSKPEATIEGHSTSTLDPKYKFQSSFNNPEYKRWSEKLQSLKIFEDELEP
jgi:hypothetical protein